MKPNTLLQWLFVIALLVMAFEIQGPKLPIGGGGVWHDSTSTLVTLNKGLNVNGALLVNGGAVGGGASVPVYDEGVLKTSAMTQMSFTGTNITTTADIGGAVLVNVTTDPTLLPKSDTTKFGYLSKNNTWTGSNTFGSGTQTIDALFVTGSIVNDALTQTDTLSVIQGANFGGVITANGIINANSNLDVDYYSRLGSTGQFLKDIYLAGKLPDSTNKTLRLSHGLTKETLSSIRKMSVIVNHDTTVLVWRGVYEINSHYAPHFAYAYADSADVRITMGASCAFTGDSVFVTLSVRP